MSIKDRGFGTISKKEPFKHLIVSTKGGRAKVPKGYSMLDKEQLRENSMKGVEARRLKLKLAKEQKNGCESEKNG